MSKAHSYLREILIFRSKPFIKRGLSEEEADSILSSLSEKTIQSLYVEIKSREKKV